MAKLTVLVVGAGIGGLAAANALSRAGVNVIVLEQARALGEVGAGVQLGPNATRVLVAMDLLAPMLEVAVVPEAQIAFSYDDGRELRRVAFADTLKRTFGFPYLHMYRPDLLDTLANGFDGMLHLNAALESVIEEERRVGARLENGETIWGDALIGCDGIHSVVRKHLHGDVPARFSGSMAWRGLCPGDQGRAMGVPVVSANWWGPGGHFVHYYVAGGKYLNWVGVTPHDGSAVESWTAKGEISDALQDYDGWHDGPRDIIAATPSAMKWALHDRDPLPFWSQGRVTLLGDAAHPMLPFMAQGAAQSVEDGYILARCLTAGDGVPSALSRYERNRLDRTSWVQSGSRKNETLFHLADQEAVKARNAKMQGEVDANPDAVQPDQSRLFGYDPVNDPLDA
jgi:salicylate hydroxylase